MPIARDGLVYIAVGAAISLVAWLLLGPAAAVPFGLATLFVCWFFRDPRRTPPADEGLLLAPADGRIIRVAPVEQDPDVGEGVQVSIFMSVFNVHINRCPVSGEVTAVRHHAGRFLAAYKDEAPVSNERNEVVFTGGHGPVKCVQIAGLVARRIICRVNEGDPVTAGGKYGLIKFGSRVDVFIPSSYNVLAEEGRTTRGGLTVLARLKEEEDDRQA